MTKFIALLSLALTTNLYAANYGKYKFTMSADYMDASEVVFLLNSAGEVTILENDDYFEVESLSFFGELTLNFETGDEDLQLASFTLKDNKVITSCSALVDQPNEVLTVYGLNFAKLQRWNKVNKKYEDIATPEIFANQEACEAELLKDFAHFDQF